MSELLNNSRYRKETLKKLILKLHEGGNPGLVRAELISSLQNIPYGEVVEVEQELIAEGLPESEVLKLCDIHGEVLEGHIDQSGEKTVPEGQPVHEVLAAAKRLKDNEILEIIAPFIPAPLLDKTIGLEYKHWLDGRSDTEYRVYFRK